MPNDSSTRKTLRVVDVGRDQIAGIIDPQNGALAEAQAIADVLELAAVDGLSLRDGTGAVLSRMLSERLKAVRETVERSAVEGRT